MRNTPKLTRDQQIILIVIVILACLMAALLALLVFLLVYKPEPPSQLTPTADPSWAHIQSTGRILIGTSADYPPFEYYNDSLQLDGFDIALMKEVGAKLGIEVVFQDIIFDSLGSSLNLGQINAAISAITTTPEREAVYSFSDVYYVSEEGILAKADSPITSITSGEQLAGWRVGVQAASVYQTWLQTNLVDSGKMPASNLLVYPRVDQAVNDLNAGKVDLLVMDYLPARDLAAQGGVKVVGKGNYQQRYAIMLRQGNEELRSKINEALLQLQNEGRVSQLAQTYLDINPDQVVPPPTAAPTALPSPLPTSAPLPPTATPPGYCIDGMAFVADLTYPDYNMTTFSLIPPNTPFQKGWRIRNTGSCTWNAGYVLRFVNGNHPEAGMSGAPTPISGSVQPGANYDIYVNLVSPSTPGMYQSFWALTNPRGETFGQRLWVAIQVPQPGPPTVPVQPTSTIPFPTSPVQPTPTSPIPAPLIYLFEVNPSSIIEGQCTFLSWEVRGDIDQIRILRNGRSIWDSAPAKYALTECPEGVSVITYEIQASGPSGTAREARQLMIYPAGQPTPKSALLMILK
jgi:ABC-type amino acid transport substrate-binding protein